MEEKYEGNEKFLASKSNLCYIINELGGIVVNNEPTMYKNIFYVTEFV